MFGDIGLLAFNYSELLWIIVHCNWIVKKKKLFSPTSLFSHFSLLFPLSLLSSLFSLLSIVPLFVLGGSAKVVVRRL